MDPIRAAGGCRLETRLGAAALLVAALSLPSCTARQAPSSTLPVDADAGAAAAESPPPTVAAATTNEPRGEVAADPSSGAAPPRDFTEKEPPVVELDLPAEVLTESPHDDLAEVTPEIDPEELAKELERLRDEPPEIDLPVVTNDRVLSWLDYYANQHPNSFRPGLERSGRYVEMFRRIFAEAGLPRDLVYMAHVESAYKTTAYSRARAKGIFQFIAATARRYGLRVDYWVDERSDPEKSARAAAAFLSDLYEEFGDWYLALAAYNAGEGKIRRALARSGRKDFWGIARTRHIRRETKNYVPAILAAVLISKDPGNHGFEFVADPPIVYDSIEVRGAADLRVLARCAGSDVETLRALNPALRRQQTPPDATTTVRVPLGSGEQTLAALQRVPVTERVLYTRHPVTSGESLWIISRKYGVGVGAIQQTNGMGRSTLIRPGQVLIIPTAAASGYDAAYAVETTNAPDGEPLTYRVRRGDTLYRIARTHRTTPAAIAAANGIRIDKILQIGERLTVVPGARSTEQARSSIGGAANGRAASAVTHTVSRGDTLWRIATRYRTTVDRLCALNSISPSTTLYPGVILAVAP